MTKFKLRDCSSDLIEPYNVSVIVPVYNAGKYISQAISSLLEQTLSDIEIIIIDDGSTDDSLNIVNAVVMDHPKHKKSIKIISRENKGVSFTRAEGVKHATGKFIIHFDSDDWMDPTMLEKMYKHAEQTDADMLICDYYLVTDSAQKYIEQQAASGTVECIESILSGNVGGFTWNKLIKRKLIIENKITFNHDLNYLEDMLFIINILLVTKKIVFLNEALYFYRQDNVNSLTSIVDKSKIRSVIKVTFEIESIIDRYGLSFNSTRCLGDFKLTQKVWWLSRNKTNVIDAVWDMFQNDKLPIIGSRFNVFYKVVLILNQFKLRFLARYIMVLGFYIQKWIKGNNSNFNY